MMETMDAWENEDKKYKFSTKAPRVQEKSYNITIEKSVGPKMRGELSFLKRNERYRLRGKRFNQGWGLKVGVIHVHKCSSNKKEILIFERQRMSGGELKLFKNKIFLPHKKLCIQV